MLGQPHCETEQWRDIPSYFGAYQASNLGRIRGVDRVLGDGRRWPERVLKPRPLDSGYLRVRICGDGGQVDRKVHQLVAEAFIGPRPEGLYVLHGDGDKLNNRADNLRYGTAADNWQDYFNHKSGKNANSLNDRCPNGHEYTPENVYQNGPKGRSCLQCKRARGRRWRRKQNDQKQST